ncbi:MAG: histidine phosphatase family protein [Mariprofundales bacterium]
MKTLTLMRHAKSDWHNSEQTDVERPLNARGLRDAPNAGRRWAAAKIPLDCITHSTAQRAWETSILFSSELSAEYKTLALIGKQSMYLSSSNNLLKIARLCSEDVQHLMLVAHNPGMGLLAQQLDFSDTIDDFPTCAIARFEIATTLWADLQGKYPLQFFDTPKQQAF